MHLKHHWFVRLFQAAFVAETAINADPNVIRLPSQRSNGANSRAAMPHGG
jgi:hypothetical protein